MAYVGMDGSLIPGRVSAGVLPGDSLVAPTVIAVFEHGDADASGDGAVASPTARADAVAELARAVTGARDAADGIDIGFAYPSDPLWLDVEREELRMALDVLLARAVRSAADGSVAVRCMPHDGDAMLDVVVRRDEPLADADLTALFEGANPRRDAGGDPRTWDDGYDVLRTLVDACNGALHVAATGSGSDRITVRLPLVSA